MMDIRDLITLYFERSNAMETFWGFYITVIFGLLAFFGTAKPSRRKVRLAAITSLGFILFAWVNWLGMHDAVQARVATQHLIAAYKDTDPAKQATIDQIKKTITPPTPSSVTGFHIGMDFFVLVAIWVLTLHREGNKPDPDRSIVVP